MPLEEFANHWALITGASSGIGAEFARQLAGRGMHLVLLARREDRLRELAEELHLKHGTRTETITLDLADPAAPGELCERLIEKDITLELLVNNAGFAVVGEIENIPPERILEMIQVNIVSLTELTERTLPGMLQRGHGAIINIASVAAFQPVAYMGAYAATKSYVLHYTEALWAEAREKGVTVMALCPGVTRTEFFEVAGVSGWLKKQTSQTPDQVVKTALRGLRKKRQYIVSGWKNYILSLLVRLAPRRTAVLESMKYFRPGKKQEPQPVAAEPAPASVPRQKDSA